jgi:hypothetical protein
MSKNRVVINQLSRFVLWKGKMKARIFVLVAIGVCLFSVPAFALNCKAQKADFLQVQKDGAADAKESYPKDVSQHGYAASASDGLDGQCYRSAYIAAYDKAKKGAKGARPTCSNLATTDDTRRIPNPSSCTGGGQKWRWRNETTCRLVERGGT